ncbi:MAG: helix-turn-helix domain-containing protein [Ignavibacteria bacterium]|nr:helix-turn-helix domain-containing protein [Ignavibacteria bacterium]
MLNKFANDLKSAREKAGLTLMDMASETRLHYTIFEKIESGDFNFQPLPYIKAFIKQYARCVNLNPEQVIKDFDSARTGRYTVKKSISKPKADKEEKEPEIVTEEVREDIIKEKEEPEAVIIPEIITEDKEKVEEAEDVYELPEDKQLYSRPRKIQFEKESFSEQDTDKKPHFSKSFSDNIKYLKYAGIFVVILLIGFGIFYFAKTIFFNSEDNVEIVRQSPQDVEDENISKTTIDSLKLAKEKEEADLKNKITLKVVAREDGRIIVATDEKITRETELVELKKGQEREWRAKEYFYLRTLNSNAFKVTLNDKNVRFRLKDTRNARISWVENKVDIKD